MLLLPLQARVIPQQSGGICMCASSATAISEGNRPGAPRLAFETWAHRAKRDQQPQAVPSIPLKASVIPQQRPALSEVDRAEGSACMPAAPPQSQGATGPVPNVSSLRRALIAQSVIRSKGCPFAIPHVVSSRSNAEGSACVPAAPPQSQGATGPVPMSRI